MCRDPYPSETQKGESVREIIDREKYGGLRPKQLLFPQYNNPE